MHPRFAPARKARFGTSCRRGCRKDIFAGLPTLDLAQNDLQAALECVATRADHVVVPVWISLAERFLIEHYRPIWNTVIDGFGNHDPGMGRRNMKRPRWDILHPGREWAERLRPAETADRIISELG